MPERQPEADGGAVIENVDGEFPQRQRRDEGFDRGGQIGEAVFVLALPGHGGEAVAGQVRGDDPVGAREERDQIAELVGGGGEAVQEEDDGRVEGAGGAVEDVHAIGFEGGDLGLGWGGHGSGLASLSGFGCVCFSDS